MSTADDDMMDRLGRPPRDAAPEEAWGSALLEAAERFGYSRAEPDRQDLRHWLKQRPEDQPLPAGNDEVDCQTRAVQWIDSEIPARRELGIQRYGNALQPRNGRSSTRDLGEELLDSVVYFQQVRAEFNALAQALADAVQNWGVGGEWLHESLREGERLLMELGWYEHGGY